MSLTEFMEDASMGSPSWIEDDFDITNTLSPTSFGSQSSGSFPSPFGNYSNRNNRGMDRNRGGFGRDFIPRDKSEPFMMRGESSPLSSSASSWRNSIKLNRAHNYAHANIVVFENLPPNCTRQLIKEFFESRYTKFEEVHVLLDPSDANRHKKLALIILCNPADLQKVIKWSGFNLDGKRIKIESATSNELHAVLDYNKELEYDEDAEDESIETMNRPMHGSRRDSSLGRNDNVVHARPKPADSKPKVNPFGNAKPVDVPDLPMMSDETKIIAEKLHLENKELKDLVPHNKHDDLSDIAESTKPSGNRRETKPEKMPKEKLKPKANPFGNAKPVDTLSKLMEIEKKLQKAAINETTYDLGLLRKKTDDQVEAESKVKEKKNRKDSMEKKNSRIASSSPGSDDSIPPNKLKTLKIVETVEKKDKKKLSQPDSDKQSSPFDRREARELSKEEYEEEVRKHSIRSADGKRGGKNFRGSRAHGGKRRDSERRSSAAEENGRDPVPECENLVESAHPAEEEFRGDDLNQVKGENIGDGVPASMREKESTDEVTEESVEKTRSAIRGGGRGRGSARGYRGRGRGRGRGGGRGNRGVSGSDVGSLNGSNEAEGTTYKAK